MVSGSPVSSSSMKPSYADGRRAVTRRTSLPIYAARGENEIALEDEKLASPIRMRGRRSGSRYATPWDRPRTPRAERQDQDGNSSPRFIDWSGAADGGASVSLPRVALRLFLRRRPASHAHPWPTIVGRSHAWVPVWRKWPLNRHGRSPGAQLRARNRLRDGTPIGAPRVIDDDGNVRAGAQRRSLGHRRPLPSEPEPARTRFDPRAPSTRHPARDRSTQIRRSRRELVISA
jgi:hypothetical protein